MPRAPNILFLMSDEHRADVTGFEGNDVIRTPVLDELARTGAVFTNAYTPAPICIPGRQAMMSGKFPRHCGCERFGQDLPPGHMTFARQLSHYGYATICCGKLHHTGADQMQGWTARPAGDVNLGPKTVPDHRPDPPPPKPSQKWSDAKEVLRAGVGEGPGASRDRIALNAALHTIRERFTSPFYDRQSNDQPILLKVSFNQPHYPYFTDLDKFTYYINRVRPFVDQQVFDHPFLSQKQVRLGEDVTERDLRRATAAYYGMIETIDACYGQVLDMLRHVGQDLDDWIIIYTTDHGEMLGEHGIWEKQKFFEASARVPLIIRWPKRFGAGASPPGPGGSETKAGRVVDRNVNLCDLFATLCDLADIPTPEGLDSRSLVPLLEGRTDGWDNETISQFGGRNLMIKRDHLKYQSYGPDMPEVLFDLNRNPEETVNFIDDPAYGDFLPGFRQRRQSLGF